MKWRFAGTADAERRRRMSYVSLYRKYRPETFSEVRGQDAVVKTLLNQVRFDRIGHAYLFSGTRGTGKTSVAKIFARAVNCENTTDGEPCNNCAMCRGILDGSSLNVIEIDAASNNGVDNIREIVEEVAYRPAEGKYRVYIVDEVHMLSTGAFNALLKTLEEPPSYVIFILATTEPNKIPVTIVSRCQRYEFHRIDSDTITHRLEDMMQAEGIRTEAKALRHIARLSDGAMRDALSLADRCRSFLEDGTLTYEKVLEILGSTDASSYRNLLHTMVSGDAAGALRECQELLYGGRTARQVLSGYLGFLRDLMLYLAAGDAAGEIVDGPEDYASSLAEESKSASLDTVLRYLRTLSALEMQLRYAGNERTLLEVAILGLCRPERITEGAIPEDISERLMQAEEREMNLLAEVNALRRMVESGQVRARADRAANPTRHVQEANSAPAPQPVAASAPEVNAGAEPLTAEKLETIRERWREILGLLRNRLARQMLSDADLCAAQDGALEVLLKNKLASRLPEDAELIREMRTVLDRKLGIRAAVRLRMAQDESEANKVVSVEEILKDRIHMEIEEE